MDYLSCSCDKGGDIMLDYKELYIIMVDASERAIGRKNHEEVKNILIAAEQECEEKYISAPRQR